MPNPVRMRRLGTGGPTPGHAAGIGIGNLSCPSNSGLQISNIGPWSMTAWVYLPSVPTAYTRVISKGGGTVATDEWGLQVNPTGGPGSTATWEWYFSTGTTYHTLDWSAALVAGSWQFIFVAWVQSTEQLFMSVNNGTLVSTPNLAAVPHSDVNPVLFGQDYGTGLGGRIDAVNIWVVNLSPTQVSDLYNNGAGRRYSQLPKADFGGIYPPTAWWDLDGPIGRRWRDSSRNGNHLTPTGVVRVVPGKT